MNTNLDTNELELSDGQRELAALESYYTYNARFFAKTFLLLVHRYRLPRQQARLVEYMMDGFETAPAYAQFHNLRHLSDRVDGIDKLVEVFDLILELDELAKPREGGGNHE